MSEVLTVRGFINQRLSAAAEEIFELFEVTIAEYEAQLCRSKEENERQKKLLEAVYNPEVRLHKADVQQLVVSKEPPPEQQKGGQGLEQEDSELPHIKEEHEDIWSSQEGEQLQELEEETPQSSQLHQKQNEEDRDSEEGPGPVSDSDPETEDNSGDTAEPETEVINAHQQTEEAHLGLNPSKNGTENLSVKPFPCSQCGRQFSLKGNLKTHMRVHTGEKPFSCPVCGKGFAHNNGVQRHVKSHTRKWHSCKLCDKRFLKLRLCKRHMRTHTREKPFTGNSCNNRFTKQKPQSSQPQQKHSKEITAESEDEVISAHTQTKKRHLGLKYSKNGTENSKVPLFRCFLCGKSFSQRGNLKRHMRVHTGEKPFRCSVCGRGFAQKVGVQKHFSCHTGEKPFSCSLCDKRFAHLETLKQHLRTHTEEKSFTCSSCNKRFNWLYQFKKHRCGAV